MNSVEIRDKKDIAIQRMNAIVSTCKSEVREMTEEEANEYNALKAEVEQLKQAFAELQAKLQGYEEDVQSVENEEEQPEEIQNNRNKTNTNKMEFRLIKAINDIANNRRLSDEYNNYVQAGAEEMRKAGLPYGGQLQLRTAIQATVATAGQEAIAEDKAPILEAIKNNLVLTQAGATFMSNLVGNISIPTYSGSSCGWAGEIDAAADGAGTFGEVTLSPKRLTCFVDISKQMLNQASDDVEAMIRRDITNAISQKLESTILGTGKGDDDTPAGIAQTATASVNTYAGILALEENFEGKTYGEKVWIVSPKAKSSLKAKDKGTDTGNYLIQNGEMDGYRVLTSANVPANYFMYGDFSDLVVAQWGAIDITVDPFSQAANGKVRLVVNAYFDAKLRRSSSVAVASTTTIQSSQQS